MISFNHVLKSAEEYPDLKDDFHKGDLFIKEESKKIVIINPVFNDGQGDFELARKLEKCIAAKGLQAVTVSLIEKYNRENYTCTYENLSRESKKIKNLLVVVAPFSFCNPKALIQAFKNHVIITEHTKVVMIDEMETDSQYSFHDYKDEFETIGIQRVYEKKLGFGKNCIGYVSIEESEQVAIKQRSKRELDRLFDSFHLNLDPFAHYYVGYLNSDIKLTSSQVFMINTLLGLKEHPSSVNYFFSLGKGDWKSDVKKISKGACGILPILEELDKDIAHQFSKVNIILVDVYKNKIFHSKLQSRQKKGGIPINVVFMNSKQMPKNIWHHFIVMSKSGVMTGDQSFCDYLSLKKEMPFYEMRDWKWPLRQSLIDSAEKFGGKELKEYVRTKIFGRMPPCGDISYQLMNRSLLNDRLNSDFQNFGTFLSQKVANESIGAYLKSIDL
ncbi:MAG: hypothetical protein LBC45_03935 [Chlamydiales bacterium]|nr:hypothetical protein [Chlamydiales bacterium]